MICWKLKLLFLILSTIMTYNTNIIYTVLLSIDTLIQNEHQYFTCLAGSQPISFRRQLKIRDRLIEHQSATQLIQHQSEFFPSFCTFAVFSLWWYFSWRWSISSLYPSKVPDQPLTNSTRLSVYSRTTLSQLFVLNQVRIFPFMVSKWLFIDSCWRGWE